MAEITENVLRAESSSEIKIAYSDKGNLAIDLEKSTNFGAS